MPGRYFVVEGIDGSGKSLLSTRLSESLGARRVSEPTNGLVGQTLRSFMKAGETANAAVMAHLFAADRQHMYDTVVRPTLAAGLDIVSDRSVISSLAYQATSPDMMREIWDLNNALCKIPAPDLVIFIDTSLDVALQRLNARSNERDRFEQHEFLRAVVQRYDIALRCVPWPVVRVDGQQDGEAVLSQALGLLS